MPKGASKSRPFLGSVDIDEFFTDEDLERMDRKEVKRVIRDISRANNTISFYWRLGFAGVEVAAAALMAGSTARDAGSFQPLQLGAAVQGRRFEYLLPASWLSWLGFLVAGAQVLMALFIMLNSRRVHLYFMVALSIGIDVAASVLVSICLVQRQPLPVAFSVLTYFSTFLCILGYMAERMSYRADQGVYELKKTAASNMRK